ncbi:MAG: hypothetical protein WKF79_08030 [Nocardioides sp.]
MRRVAGGESMSDHAVLERLRAYREHGLPRVQGWFDEESADVIGLLLAHQLDLGVRGNVAEIGVHHGKSFLLLANGARDDEQAVAVDVFGDQEKNHDRSGRGDRTVFEANIAAWAPAAQTHLVQCSSLELAAPTARETFGESA